MGNAMYAKNVMCYNTIEDCAKTCGKYECVFVDKCNGNSNLNYVCLPFNLQFLMWLMFGAFLVVLLCCSTLVACYACRAIRASFRHAVGTDGDIIFQNPRGVVAVPHPGAKYAHSYEQSRNNYYHDYRKDSF